MEPIMNRNRNATARSIHFTPDGDPRPLDEIFANPDHETLVHIISAYRELLVTTAEQRCGSLSDAEDIVQDVCLDALEGHLDISTDPSRALDDLLRAVTSRRR
jgi:DNA-directed RNA polymerase specialized sigma24 family protein